MSDERAQFRWSDILDSAIGHQSQTTLLVTVTLLIVLTVGAICLGALVAYEFDASARKLEVAARQRMLTQQMAKAALVFSSAPDGAAHDGALNELLDASQQFDLALQALSKGGESYTSEHRKQLIAPLEEEAPRELLIRLEDTWMRVAATAAPRAEQLTTGHVNMLIGTLAAHDEELLDLSDQLFTSVEATTRERLLRLHLAQALCFLLALLSSLALLFLVLRQLVIARRGVRQREVMETVAAGICLVDATGRIIAANSAAATLFGRSIESLEGEPLPALDTNHRIEQVTPDGRRVLAQVTRKPLPAPSVLDIVTLQDITDHIEHAEFLHSQAHHDALTGLPNRRLFEDRIDVAIAQATRVRQRVGIAMIDLDNFKPVNDTYGHAIGDLVLQTVAQRIAACARAGDTVARLGGDEFVCVFTGIGGREHLAALGQRLLDSLGTPLEHGGQFLPVAASIGLATFPDDAEEPTDLIARADACMYAAKQAGGNCMRFNDE